MSAAPKTSHANRGAGFEQEIRDAFQALRVWNRNLNNVGKLICDVCLSRLVKPKRDGDREACWRGFLVLAECKETAVSRIQLDRVESHQWRALESVARAGGIALVLVKWTRPGRAFTFTIEEWNALAARGEKGVALPAGTEMQKARVRETVMLGEPNPLVWDLRAVLDREIQKRLPTLRAELEAA